MDPTGASLAEVSDQMAQVALGVALVLTCLYDLTTFWKTWPADLNPGVGVSQWAACVVNVFTYLFVPLE